MTESAVGQWRRRAVTTRTLIDLDYRLELRCRGCARIIVAEPYELRLMFPEATPLREAGQRLRCQQCGANNPKMWVWVMGWTRDKRRRR